jgi:thioesterase domain-containing protein
MRLGMRLRLVTSRLPRRGRNELQRTPESFQLSLFSALDRYKPEAYDGHTLLIRTSGKPCPDVDYRTDPTNGWHPVFTGNFEVVSIDCRHDQLLTEHVPFVANIVAEALARARQRFASVHARPGDNETSGHK